MDIGLTRRSISAKKKLVDDFVRNLLQLPSEPEILSEAVYANSPTLDGRRFAEEFVRRRKLADKGVVVDGGVVGGGGMSFVAGAAAEGGKGGGGGWSEVAKKGPGNHSGGDRKSVV